MLPEAHVSHQATKRLRIRIPSRKGDRAYFQSLGKELVEYRKFDVLQLNHLTASVLFLDEELDVNGIAEYARENSLFDLPDAERRPVPLSRRIAGPLSGASSFLSRTTGGLLDLPGTAFVLLLGIGLYEILRGNFRAPPWYTAFWYAFGVFTKSLVDIASKKEDSR